MQTNATYPIKQLFPEDLPSYLQFKKDKNALMKRLKQQGIPLHRF